MMPRPMPWQNTGQGKRKNTRRKVFTAHLTTYQAADEAERRVA